MKLVAKYLQIHTLFILVLLVVVGVVGSLRATPDSAIADSGIEGFTFGLQAAILMLLIPAATRTKTGVAVAAVLSFAPAALMTALAVPSDDGMSGLLLLFSWAASITALLVAGLIELLRDPHAEENHPIVLGAGFVVVGLLTALFFPVSLLLCALGIGLILVKLLQPLRFASEA